MSIGFRKMWSVLRPRTCSLLHPVSVLNATIIRPFSIPPTIAKMQTRAYSVPSSSTPVSTTTHLPPKAADHDLASAQPLSQAPMSMAKRISAYCELSKLKLSTFVVITAGAGFSVAPAPAYDFSTLQLFGCAMLGTLLCSGCANTINQIREVKYDAMMKRTANRPLPSGAMTKFHAAAFAAFCGLSGTGLLYACVNPLTAALGAANILLYAGPYTSMKRTTIWNTWVGAIVGAVPPVMGWTAVTGSVAPPALLLAGILFSWQLPHFMSLAFVSPTCARLAPLSQTFSGTWPATTTSTAATRCCHALIRAPPRTLPCAMRWPCPPCCSHSLLCFNMARSTPARRTHLAPQPCTVPAARALCGRKSL